MDFHLTCSCGARSTINEGAAGVKLICSCGKEIAVPTFAELRRLTDVPEDPERLIRAGLDEHDLFPDKQCCQCRAGTDAWIPVIIECEPGYKEGGFAWGTFLIIIFLSLFSAFGIVLFRWRPTVVHAGKGYRVPLLICTSCQKSLHRTAVLKKCLRTVPVYDSLLEKYPDAHVRLIDE